MLTLIDNNPGCDVDLKLTQTIPWVTHVLGWSHTLLTVTFIKQIKKQQQQLEKQRLDL